MVKFEAKVLQDSSYPKRFGREEVMLPRAATHLHGCLNCEWKGSSLCSFGFKRKDENHINGICVERVNWLKSFTRLSLREPSFEQWRDDFNEGLGQVQMQKDFFELQLIEGRVAAAEDVKLNLVDLKRLRERKVEARREWFELWGKLRVLAGKRLDREHVKRLQIDVEQKIKIGDINRILREGDDAKVIEAEIVEIKKESEVLRGNGDGMEKTEEDSGK